MPYCLSTSHISRSIPPIPAADTSCPPHLLSLIIIRYTQALVYFPPAYSHLANKGCYLICVTPRHILLFLVRGRPVFLPISLSTFLKEHSAHGSALQQSSPRATYICSMHACSHAARGLVIDCTVHSVSSSWHSIL